MMNPSAAASSHKSLPSSHERNPSGAPAAAAFFCTMSTTLAANEEEMEVVTSNDSEQGVPTDACDEWNRGMLDVSSSITKLVDCILVDLEKIGNAMSEKSATTKQVAEELQKIEGLTLVDIMTAGKAISSDSFMRAMFLSLPSEKRKEMVLVVLKK